MLKTIIPLLSIELCMARGDKPATLEELLAKTLDLVEGLRIPSLLVGGLAVGIVGEARVTEDVDLILALPIHRLVTLAQRAKAAGFSVATASLEEAKATGAVRFRWHGLHVDVILTSTAFERSAFARKLVVTLAGRKMSVPSPEDLILLKLVPGRDKDLLDVKGIMVRHRHRLDRKYLAHWAERLDDEAQESRIWTTLHRLLAEVDRGP